MNGDTTWLYQIPLTGSKRWYNILLDPWFSGTTHAVHRWVIQITHTILPAFSSVDEVVELCAKVDELCGTTGTLLRRRPT